MDVNGKNVLNLNCHYYPYSRSQIIKETSITCLIPDRRRALPAERATFLEAGFINNIGNIELKIFLTNVSLRPPKRNSESYLLTLHRGLENSHHTTPQFGFALLDTILNMNESKEISLKQLFLLELKADFFFSLRAGFG